MNKIMDSMVRVLDTIDWNDANFQFNESQAMAVSFLLEAILYNKKIEMEKNIARDFIMRNEAEFNRCKQLIGE